MGRKSDILGSSLEGWETTKNNMSSLYSCMWHTPAYTHTSTYVGCLLPAKCIGIYLCTYTHIYMHTNVQPGHKYAHRLKHVYAHRYYTHTYSWYKCAQRDVRMYVHIHICICTSTGPSHLCAHTHKEVGEGCR